MGYHVLAKHNFTVAALETIGEDWQVSCPALEFLQSSFDDVNKRSSCRGYRALFELLAQYGPSKLTSAMMHEVNKEHSILELIKGKLRLLCFIERDTIFLTNGYVKASQKADTTEVAKSIKMKTSYSQTNPSVRSVK